jgi:RNA polymerase sigma-70 factor (ECF subfamily)
MGSQHRRPRTNGGVWRDPGRRHDRTPPAGAGVCAAPRLGDEALADDLTQETFLRAERSRSSYRGEASERSWLCAIVLNLIRDHFRAAGRIPATTTAPQALDRVSSDEDGEHALLESEMAACVGEFLLQLPQPQHDVLALHDMAGLTHPEIAAVLDLSVANSRVLLHRGRAVLRKILEQNCTLSFDGDSIPCERKEGCS